ncbi:LOW QUALITY PROTEIN: frataxin, mitochondrial [Rhopalosiphum maidis]|uniref:LOW QUALITY PROTEIN: frataxin, mitochondrial n=1 Tax=Rhopalosiphum maidis TaxID=43146 RepID=UPI000F0085C8|nr:LOW QUALITY PROTEIN: frataxin, mitochondrial [Rhopalosiphum maidis]
MTSLKILQSIVSKNEFFTKILLKPKREYCCFNINRLQFKYYSFQHQIKCNPYDSLSIQKFSMSKQFSTSNNQTEIDFEQTCNETLESLCEYFEQIIEDNPQLENPDILFSDGVLTVQLGEPYGTYVINRQTPNKQIWLSSPISGPKRYDFNGIKWIYKHDGVSLHELLTCEFSKEYSFNVNFSNCIFSGTLSK